MIENIVPCGAYQLRVVRAAFCPLSPPKAAEKVPGPPGLVRILHKKASGLPVQACYGARAYLIPGLWEAEKTTASGLLPEGVGPPLFFLIHAVIDRTQHLEKIPQGICGHSRKIVDHLSGTAYFLSHGTQNMYFLCDR